MIKVKRQSLKSMASRVQRKQLMLENRLLESQLDWLDTLVDPREAYIDELTGEKWKPIGGGYGVFEERANPYHSEEELGQVRRKARLTLRANPYAENLMVNLCSFVVGKGHVYKASPRPGWKNNGNAKQNSNRLQKYVDKLLKMNKWAKRQKEAYRRLHRDGEVFIRIFPQEDGYARFRFVEPIDVSTPPQYKDDPTATFGIKTDSQDVETVEWYFVRDIVGDPAAAYMPDAWKFEEVPYYEMQHRKVNVDLNSKRGLTTLYCVGENLERARVLLRNMSTVVQAQSAIAMIRKHNKTSTAVKNFASKNATTQRTSPLTGETRNYKRIKPGTILDTKNDVDYEFPSIGLNPGAPVAVLGAELRSIASAKALPEYMVGSDASNANYSSTMVAESPAVRFFEGEQADQIEHDLELIWAAVDYAVESGLLPPEVRTQCDIEATAPELVTREPYNQAQTDEIYLRNRVVSPQAIANRLGYDPCDMQRDWDEFDDKNLDYEKLPMPSEIPQKGPPQKQQLSESKRLLESKKNGSRRRKEPQADNRRTRRTVPHTESGRRGQGGTRRIVRIRRNQKALASAA